MHKFNGLLYIGDLHGSSTRPGRRVDDYAKTSLDKLSQCAAICHEQNLRPLFLGDLLHRSKENDLAYISALAQVCSSFPVPMLVLLGSHDHTETTYTPRDAAHLLHMMGAIKAVDHAGLAETLEINGVTVNVWATPATCDIPDSVDASPDTFNVMLTHHDLEFFGTIPNCLELKEIVNCQMLVNGHMHKPAPMQVRGMTSCFNPGSIMRVAVDERFNKPGVSKWTPAHGSSLERIPLQFAENVFDLTGKEVYAATPAELKASMPTVSLTRFAAHLRSHSGSLEAGRTEDGIILLEELGKYFELFEKPPALKNYLTGLIKTTLEARKA